MRVSLEQAQKILNEGGVVAIPTETVYGLAASLNDTQAIQRIFQLKGRPQDNPLIVHISDLKQLDALVENIPASFSLLQKFWPGPLTIVFQANAKTVPTLVRAELPTVGVRMPNHQLTLDLISQTGPLVAPSANLSGKPSATNPEHVEEDFGKDFPVLDGGVCQQGVESTIVLLEENSWELLRKGAISEEEISSALKQNAKLSLVTDKPKSPGQKYRHYSPQAKLTLCFQQNESSDKERSENFDAVLGFEDTKTTLKLVSLGLRGDFTHNLQKLYQALRFLDAQGFKSVLVDAEFARVGLGQTLFDRLQKASAS